MGMIYRFAQPVIGVGLIFVGGHLALKTFDPGTLIGVALAAFGAWLAFGCGK